MTETALPKSIGRKTGRHFPGTQEPGEKFNPVFAFSFTDFLACCLCSFWVVLTVDSGNLRHLVLENREKC